MSRNMAGTLVIPEGYEDGSTFFSKLAIESIFDNFKGTVPIRWFGINAEAEADGEFKPDMPVCGDAYNVSLKSRKQGSYEMIEAVLAIDLDTKVLELLQIGKVRLDPVFELYEYELLGDKKIAINVQLKGIFIRRSA